MLFCGKISHLRGGAQEKCLRVVREAAQLNAEEVFDEAEADDDDDDEEQIGPA